MRIADALLQEVERACSEGRLGEACHNRPSFVAALREAALRAFDTSRELIPDQACPRAIRRGRVIYAPQALARKRKRGHPVDIVLRGLAYDIMRALGNCGLPTTLTFCDKEGHPSLWIESVHALACCVGEAQQRFVGGAGGRGGKAATTMDGWQVARIATSLEAARRACAEAREIEPSNS